LEQEFRIQGDTTKVAAVHRTAMAIESLPLSESLALSEVEWVEWVNRLYLFPRFHASTP
jgi:hypothetical protein